MKKFTKQLLTGVVALGLLAPVATATLNNNPQVTVNAKRHHRRARAHWYKGAPRILRHNSQWLSNPVRTSSSRRYRYTRTITPMGGRYGFNPTPFMFNTHHHFTSNGADAGAAMAVNAHYKVLGYHKYEVKSGADGDYIYATVKVHNRNHISIWCDGQYYGYFHRMSNHAAHHFYYHPYF